MKHRTDKQLKHILLKRKRGNETETIKKNKT